MIVLLTGYRGAGKSSVSAEMVRRGWSHVSMGDLIRRRIIGTGMSAHAYGDLLRKTHGPNAVASLVEDAGIPRKAAKLLIDGIYTLAEYETLCAYFEIEVVLVGLVVDHAMRVDRLRSRGREDDAPDILDLLEKRHATLEIGVLLDRAALLVENSESVRASADRIVAFIEARST